MKPKQFISLGVVAVFLAFLGVITLVEAQLTNQLAALYHFDGDAYDASPNGNNALAQGATFTSNGMFDGALLFDGINDSAQVPDSASLDISQAITVAAWINPQSIANTNAQDRVVAKPSAYELMLSTNDSGCLAGGNGDVVFRLYFTNGTNRRICGGSIALNAWSHIAGTYDGSQMKVYVNGTLQTTFSQAGTIITNNNGVFIGNSNVGDRPFHGMIDETAIWNRSLSAAEIQDAYSGGPIGGGTPTPPAPTPTATPPGPTPTPTPTPPMPTPTPTPSPTPTPTPTPPPSEGLWPTNGWVTATPAEAGMDGAKLTRARNFATSKGGGSGLITRGGRAVMSWGNQSTLYDLRSTTKSIGVTALGLAMKDGLVNLSDKGQQHLSTIGVPPDSNKNTGWLDDITLRHLATQTAGFEKPGGFGRLLFQPGTKWFYSDGGPNWLADILTVTYRRDLSALLFQRVFSFLGITSSDLTWRSNIYRPDTIDGIKRREFGSGIKADVDTMARIGYLYLRNGQWEDQQIIESSFVNMARQPVPGVAGLPLHDPIHWPGSPNHYGLLWWNNADGTLANVPTDAYWSWGLNESLIIVIPSLDIVASRAGSAWQSTWNANYSVIEPFITPIAQSVSDGAPPPPSGGLIAHWMLDESSGLTAPDSAGSNHGTLVGGPI